MKKHAIFGMAVVSLVAACGDPLAKVDKYNDVEFSQNDASAAALPTDAEVAREGFFGTDAANPDANMPVETSQSTVAAPAQRRGLFGMLRRAGSNDRPDDQGGTDVMAETPSALDAPEATGASASESAQEIAALAPEPAPQRRGFFSRLMPSGKDKPRTGPDALDIEFGMVLPFGAVARVCAAKGKPMGQKVDDAPARGYVLYDSQPESATARTFYITGFDDGCPRQLTAATVMFAAPSLYDQLHYGPGAENLARGETDVAYETVKKRVCRAGPNQPCGAKIKTLEKDTFFVTAYQSFANMQEWSELLINNGSVVAAAIKSNPS